MFNLNVWRYDYSNQRALLITSRSKWTKQIPQKRHTRWVIIIIKHSRDMNGTVSTIKPVAIQSRNECQKHLYNGDVNVVNEYTLALTENEEKVMNEYECVMMSDVNRCLLRQCWLLTAVWEKGRTRCTAVKCNVSLYWKKASVIIHPSLEQSTPPK